MILQPYDYQVEALEAVNQGWGDGVQRGLVVLPTGTGKTLIIGEVAKTANRVLVLEQWSHLVRQTAEALTYLCPQLSVGILQRSLEPKPDDFTIVASMQTLARPVRLQRWKDFGFDLIICDEAHHGVAASYRTIFQELGCFDPGGTRLLGLTATGKRGDRVALGHVFQEIFYQRTLEEMILQGHLVDLKAVRVSTDITIEELDLLKKQDFGAEQLEPLINTENRNQLIVEAFLHHGGQRKTLCFATGVQHAMDLAEKFRQAGVTARHIHGRMSSKARKQVLEEFNQGQIQVLTNYNLLIEGYDEPPISCLIMARPTRSWTLYMQMLGRGVRRCEGKENCLVIDVADICRNYEVWDLPTLLGEELKHLISKNNHQSNGAGMEVKTFSWNKGTINKVSTGYWAEYLSGLVGNRLWSEFLELLRRRGLGLVDGNGGLTIALSPDEYVTVVPEGDGFQVDAISFGQSIHISQGVISPPWSIRLVSTYIESRIDIGGVQHG